MSSEPGSNRPISETRRAFLGSKAVLARCEYGAHCKCLAAKDRRTSLHPANGSGLPLQFGKAYR